MSKPKENETYLLIGGTDDKCISNGNTWEESRVTLKKGKIFICNDDDKLVSIKESK